MFTKKQTHLNLPTSMSSPFTQKSLNSTHLNHEFFLLVRDQRYEQAYKLGIKILNGNPNNPAIENFCDFIRNNHKGLEKMVQDEQEYTDDSEEEDNQGDEDGDDDEDESDQEKESEASVKSLSNSIISKASSVSVVSAKKFSSKQLGSQKLVRKSESNKENSHKWDHNCKNPTCPNKNKPHKH